MLILINDHWVSRENARVNLLSDAFMYGFGVFETLRTFGNRKVFRLKEHVDRLFASATAIGLAVKYSAPEIISMVNRVVAAADYPLQQLKIIATPEDLIIISTELIIDESVYAGASVISIVQHRALPHVKSLSYLECFLAYRRAQKAGCFEALLVDEAGYVYEGSRSNLFWFEGETLVTRKEGVLAGITRQAICDISPFPVAYANITLADLMKRSEIFLSNTTRGIVPIVKIDDMVIGTGKRGKNTEMLMEKYKQLVSRF